MEMQRVSPVSSRQLVSLQQVESGHHIGCCSGRSSAVDVEYDNLGSEVTIVQSCRQEDQRRS